MAAKLLVNGKAGSGKTSLLSSLEDAYVISRDGKEFPFAIPHTTFTNFNGIIGMINGWEEDVEGETVYHEGIIDKLEKYKEVYGTLPKTVVWDSVSKTLQDIIDYSNLTFKNFDIHSNINKEVAILTKFIQEYLVAQGVNVVLLNHVFYSESEGSYMMTGQGKFREKGGFYSEVDNSIFVEVNGAKRTVYHNDPAKLSRTLVTDLPAKQPLANFVKGDKETDDHYNLQKHIDQINSVGVGVKKFEL